ncbi:hypothetical protein AB0L97_26990 [Nocardia sp. NPDC051911]|uniref:hypothetical protein n=1 Tax=Nocardia sp. NPDC051911 TaxID=3154648 RepID=UPI0034336148
MPSTVIRRLRYKAASAAVIVAGMSERIRNVHVAVGGSSGHGDCLLSGFIAEPS